MQTNILSYLLLWSKTALRTIVKEFPKPREETPKFFEEYLVIIGARDSRLPDPHLLGHTLAGPGKAPTWTQEARCQNPEDDVQDPRPSTSQGPEEAHKKHLNPYKPLLGSSSPTLIGLLYKLANKTKQKPQDESVADFKSCLEALLLQHLGFCTINKVTQSALAALFVNRLSPEIGGLTKR